MGVWHSRRRTHSEVRRAGKEIFSIPNILSGFRLLLIPVFLIVYFRAETTAHYHLAAIVLLVSGLTDVVDGIIARKFDQITELGKALDPLADKLTQITVSVCLAIRHPALWPAAVGFILKDVLIFAGGIRIYKEKKRVVSAKWYGKAGTFLYYTAACLVVFFPNLPEIVRDGIFFALLVFMLYAAYRYYKVYKE